MTIYNCGNGITIDITTVKTINMRTEFSLFDSSTLNILVINGVDFCTGRPQQLKKIVEEIENLIKGGE